jgi:hypothetical protein
MYDSSVCAGRLPDISKVIGRERYIMIKTWQVIFFLRFYNGTGG